MSLGAGDLMAALCDLHDRFGCERSTASLRLADGELMTVSLDRHSNLTISRDADGEDEVIFSAQASPTIADLRDLQRRRR